MELVIKALAVIIVLAVVAVLLWSFVAKTQADISTEQTTAAAAAAAANNSNGSFYGYFGYPSTTVYVTDASGNYWRRFYS
jgi:predicted permease